MLLAMTILNLKLLNSNQKNKPDDLSNENEINLKNLLNDNGFYEVINDPFVPENQYKFD